MGKMVDARMASDASSRVFETRLEINSLTLYLTNDHIRFIWKYLLNVSKDHIDAASGRRVFIDTAAS